MTYQEKRSIVSLISTLLITALYSAYMVQRYPDANPYSPDVFRFWGAFFLIFIVVTIVAKIVIYIAFNIFSAITTNETEPSITDERDRLIELKSTRNSLYTFTFGFLIAMTSLALDMPPTVMFVILICAGTGSEIVSDVSQFLYYRRGV